MRVMEWAPAVLSLGLDWVGPISGKAGRTRLERSQHLVHDFADPIDLLGLRDQSRRQDQRVASHSNYQPGREEALQRQRTAGAGLFGWFEVDARQQPVAPDVPDDR